MEEARDKNGLTEAEFLKAYDVTRFDRPSVTVDIIIIENGRVLLIKRGGHPCIGKLAFPGGFLEKDENVYEGAARELFEETCLKAKSLRQLNVASKPDRDPRTRIITVPFTAEVEDLSALKASDDAAAANWYNLSCKTMQSRGVTVFEITLSNSSERHSFMVSKTLDKTGLSADPVYTSAGKNPLAGDHAEILAMAIDRMGCANI